MRYRAREPPRPRPSTERVKQVGPPRPTPPGRCRVADTGLADSRTSSAAWGRLTVWGLGPPPCHGRIVRPPDELPNDMLTRTILRDVRLPAGRASEDEAAPPAATLST